VVLSVLKIGERRRGPREPIRPPTESAPSFHIRARNPTDFSHRRAPATFGVYQLSWNSLQLPERDYERQYQRERPELDCASAAVER
jgi:hypothetical protein